MGANLLSGYSLKCLCWAFPLDEKCKQLSLTALPSTRTPQLHRGGGQGVSAAGFGFPAKGEQGQPSTLKNDLRGCASNSPCSVSINSFLIQLLRKYSWSAQRLCTMVWPFAHSVRLFFFFFLILRPKNSC